MLSAPDRFYSGCSPSSGTETVNAAKSLLRLASAYGALNQKVQPTKAQELPILPPWLPGHDLVAEQVADDKDREEESPFDVMVVEQFADDDDREEESPFPSSVGVIDPPNDDEEDDDLSLSLYVGAENDQHLLCDASYIYKDLSDICFAEVAVVCNDPVKQSIFPVVLHSIVSSGRHHDSIRWLPHGRAFEIVDPNKFFALVVPKYFHSPDPAVFMEFVDAYGFQSMMHIDCFGAERIVFYHERFLKFRPWIAYTMEPGRKRDHGNGSSSQRAPVDQVQKVLRHLGQLPALEDVMVPLSVLIEHQLAQHQLPFAVPFAVAHAYIPTPPLVYFDWQQWGWW